MMISGLVALLLSAPAAPLQSSFAGGALDELPFDLLVEDGNLLAVSDVTGDVYIAATTTSVDFPATGDGAQPDNAGDADVVVVRMNATLTAFLGATYLGGSGTDKVAAIVVHPTTGDVFVGGSTDSADFPVDTGTLGADTEGFVAVLSGALDDVEAARFMVLTNAVRVLAFDAPTGQLVAAGTVASIADDLETVIMRLNLPSLDVNSDRSLGGDGDDVPTALVVDGGDIVIGGATTGPDTFPFVGAGAMALPPENGGAGFVLRLAGDLSAELGGTLVTGEEFGATVFGIAVDDDDLILSVVTNDDLPEGSGPLPGSATGALLRLTGDLGNVEACLYLAEDTLPLDVIVSDTEILLGGTTRAERLPNQVGDGVVGNDFFVMLVETDLSAVTRSALGGKGAAFRHAGVARTATGVVLAGFAGAGAPPSVDGGAQEDSGGGVDLFVLRFSDTLSIPGTCGDGVADGGESCDDGNTDSADGCDALCAVEDGYACAGGPSVCAPDTSDPDEDGLTTFDEVAAGTDPSAADSDGDGVLDGNDGVGDTDADGAIDALDTDDDDDGIPTAVELSDARNNSDLDEDGSANWQDTDSDDDGRDDAKEGRGDRDNDGKRDYLDAVFDPGGVVDENEDGYDDSLHAAGGGVINCAQTSGAPWLALAVLALLAARRRRALGASVMACALALPAAAQSGDTFPAQRFRPSVDRDGILEVEGAHIEGEMNADAALWVDYQLNPVTVFVRSDGSNQRAAALVGHRVDANAVAAVTLIDRLELAVDLPVVLFQTRDDAALDGLLRTVTPLQAFGVGDPRGLIKLRVLRQGADSAADVAFILAGSAPLQNGVFVAAAPSFIGERSFTVAPALSVGRSDGPLRVVGNFGARFREPTTLIDARVGNEVFYGGGAAFSFADWFQMPVELQGSLAGQVSLETPRLQTSPLEAMLGAQVTFMDSVQVFLAGGTGLLAGVPAPDLRVLTGVRFSPRSVDADGDGIEDGDDACKTEPEDNDGYADDDGCPDADNDGDGILDEPDDCVDVPEDVDGNDDEDGCPDEDNDGDGVLDGVDKCPNEAGEKEFSGCSAPDADGDGVPDASDKCVVVPGPPDTFGCPDQDGDGVLDADDRCPTQAGPKAFGGCPDTDKDGFADPDDKCPTEPETINGVDDNDGCPDKGETLVKVTREKIEILDKVFFDTNKATIKPQSFGLLDQVASVLQANPHITRIRVEGHTDDVGEDARNLTLSQQRAESVKAYLLGKGVAAERLESQGFGETRPIADNKTRDGRDNNRRVEFVIVSQSE